MSQTYKPAGQRADTLALMTDAARFLATQVLIVGGGPVGLVLAMSLARLGVAVMVAEQRARGEPPSVKCNHIAARSMEILRQLGIAGAVRDCGLPADFVNDVAFRTTTTGAELARIPIPARAFRFTDRSGPDGEWPTPEPPHRANQIYVEPVLQQCAEAQPGLDVRYRCRVVDAEQDDDGVTARAVQVDGGAHVEIRCAYLVGCDGARSWVRKKIGATFTGDDEIGRTQSTFIDAPGLLARLQHPPAWATLSLNPRRSGTVYAIDGHRRWLVHNYLARGEGFETVDRDRSLRLILGVDAAFRYDVVGKEDWIARRLVADRFRDRRLFVCGDAAHIWVPMAGYGMNAGIADAANLAWLLAAHLNGWGAAAMLDAYPRERLPITEQVSRFAMDHALAMQRHREAVPAGIEATGPAGDELRAALGRSLYALNVFQYCCAGLNFGYYYDDSPIIAYDEERAPAYTMGAFTPSTVPGCRAPHLWLRDGRSLYDAVAGPGYTLLRFDLTCNVEPLRDAARRRGVPLDVLDVPDVADVAALEATPYRHRLALLRPDQHVAWRGDRVPANALHLIDHLRGARAADA